MDELTVKAIIEPCKLQVLTGDYGLDRRIQVADINRPGLVLAGFTEHFDQQRIQLLGLTELSFLSTLTEREAFARWQTLLALYFPCIIISRGQELPEAWLKVADEKQVAILRTPLPTTRFTGNLTDFLEGRLAPAITLHGVLMEVYGVGVLITGESGIGKSETALELVKRGHRLAADDAVKLKKIGESHLEGEAPDLTRHLMEIRGLGILDIYTLFGAGSVRLTQTVNLSVRLEEWRKDKFYDRIDTEETVQYLGIAIPSVTIPVRPGRNLAGIIEVAAMNFRLKLLGHNAAEELGKRLKVTN